MQVQIKDIEQKKEKVFHPFVLEFKIESEQDLIDLWCRFNLTSMHFYDLDSSYLYEGRFPKSTTKEYNFISQLLQNKPYMK